MLRAADRATALTRQLLAFGRRQVLAPEVTDPTAVIEGIVPMLRRLLGGHIELVTSHAPGLGRVRVDPGQLEQVIVNLAVNARDAMPDGGRLAIDTANVDVDDTVGEPGSEVRLGACVRITVADTGTGMDEAIMARIFEPFFTTKETGKGTGLGLSTVYGIVRSSGGRTNVTTSPGRGTTFTIDLPSVETPAAPIPTAVPAEPLPAVSGTILLVEDEDAVRSVVARTLTRLGYSVVQAASGTDALAVVAERGGPLDLLVTDVRMPGIQGPDLARRLRADRPDLPVLFISGYAEELAADASAMPGMQVLDKPFDADTLGRAVRAALESPH